MVSKGDDTVVLWPRYFDARLSRAEGRRVAANLAVEKPDAAWMASACKKAGLEHELDEEARHPTRAWDVCGRVLVAKGHGKEDVIRTVAKAMK